MKPNPSNLLRKIIPPSWLLALAILMVLNHPGLAATRVWTGAVSPFWSNPGNWVNGELPLAGDSIEFPEEVLFRDVYNDLDLDFSVGDITIKGRNYVLQGNRISLEGNITSVPSNSTNRIMLDAHLYSPLTISNHGYFNQLEIGGHLRLWYYPMILDTSSFIKITNYLMDTNNMGVTQRGAGTVSFEGNGFLLGAMIVEAGDLILSGPINRMRIVGGPKRASLIIGHESGAPGTARAFWGHGEKLASNADVTINASGILDLAGYSQAIGSLHGSGQVRLGGGQLTVQSANETSNFAGTVSGTGSLRVHGVDGGLELSGHNTFTGRVETIASHLKLTGSASNAVVVLTDGATFTGNGVAKSLAATNAVVRPGPGTLRFFEGVMLDGASRLELDLDGPAAGRLQTGFLDLRQPDLQLTYHGGDEVAEFPLVTATAAAAGSAFAGLAEGAWLLAGDPAAPSEFQLTYAGGTGQDVMLERAGLFAPPMLSIQPLSATERRIEWPISAQGYTLQHTPNLHLPAWTANGLPAPATMATEHYVIDDTSPAQRFYRLTR